jgi:hypothetical protein
MSTNEIVALAASGSLAGQSAEDAALDYCINNKINTLLVIHVLETGLSKFGEIDQLADGASKADFVDYINERANTTARSLRDRLSAKAAECGIELSWREKQGDVVTEICEITKSEGVSLLFAGKGEPVASILSPPKNLPTKLLKQCSCQVVIVSHSDL